MDQYQREAYGSLPVGYGIVREGKILPDDLIWNWTGKEWLRADSPDWGPSVVLVEDCVAVCRTGRPKPESVARNYTVTRGKYG